MLAPLLTELIPSLARAVEARGSTGSAADTVPPGWRTEQVTRLVRRLVLALEGRQGEAPSEPPGSVEQYLEAVHLLREAVYETIDARLPDLPSRDHRFVADWFATEAERALGTANRQHAALLDSLSDHIFLHDPEFRVLVINRAYAEMMAAATGLPPDKLVGRKLIDDVKLPAPFEEYIRDVVGRVAKGETITQEFQHVLQGGHWREHHLAPVMDAQGRVTGIAVSSRDIHAHKMAQARLQLLSRIGALAATGDYEEIVGGLARLSIPELADWAVVDVVEDGRILRRTVAHRDPSLEAFAAQMLRVSPGHPGPTIDRECRSLEPRVHRSLDLPQLRERDPQLFELARQLGVSSAIVVPLPVLRSPAAVATFVFTAESGRRHGDEDLGVALDVARRAAQTMENAHLQQRLRQSEARFRVALAQANISVFEQDRDLRFIWSYNTPLAKDDHSVIGKTASELMPSDAGNRVDAWKRRVLETGEGARLEIDFDVRGVRRHFLANCEPIRSPRGILGITGAVVDVTEMKRVQQELAQGVAFRERLIGILGHDLRNPLSSVLALARVLGQQGEVPERVRQGLDRIAQSAARMNEMIGTILDFTNLRFRGEVPLSVDTVALDALASTIVDELRAAHPERTIEITSQGDVRGRWDEGRLGQVLSNLVANALSHGARDAPVRVSLSREGDGAIFAVSNRGPTISPELKERLFEAFWQGPRGGGPPRSGLGLGLFVTREIVRAHGGTIEVRSGEGTTTFTVRLPTEATPPARQAS